MYATMFRDVVVLLFFILDFGGAFPGKICKIPSADAGTCTAVNKCGPLYELHKKRPKSPEEDAFYRQSVGSCGGGGVKLKVCCPPQSQWTSLLLNPVHFPEPPIAIAHANEVGAPAGSAVQNRIQDQVSPVVPPPPLTLSVPPPSNAEKLDAWYTNWKKSDKSTESCGIDTNSAQRIVGGKATEIDEYPWLALLEYEPEQFKCGGSLISRSHVLTAAHCLYSPPSQVRLSEYNITSGPTDFVETNGGGNDSITVVIIGVQVPISHPDHVYGTSIHDIGIIKMKKKVDYGDFIKPICLPTVDYRNTAFAVTTKFTVAGWGSDNVYDMSDVKRSVYVPYVPMDVCSETFDRKPSVTQHLCAGGEKGRDSCRGDSGGPLMYEDVAASNFVIVGVVSSGYVQCGTEGRPGVYTYVYSYMPWIRQVVNE